MKLAVISVAIVGLLSVSMCSANINRTTETVSITKDPERVCSSSGEGTSCKYLIFTDQGTYENADTMWHLKFNSSDVHGSIHQGQTCEITSVGLRVPFLSWYKNAIKVECQ